MYITEIKISTNKKPLKREIWQGNQSPELFTFGRECYGKGVIVKGESLNNLRYSDDVSIIPKVLDELLQMLNKSNVTSEEVWLSMNLTKTKIMFDGTGVV